jgi:hypothetical protein
MRLRTAQRGEFVDCVLVTHALVAAGANRAQVANFSAATLALRNVVANLENEWSNVVLAP